MRLCTTAAGLAAAAPAVEAYLSGRRRWWQRPRRFRVDVYGPHGALSVVLDQPGQVAALVAAVGDGSRPPRPVV